MKVVVRCYNIFRKVLTISENYSHEAKNSEKFRKNCKQKIRKILKNFRKKLKKRKEEERKIMQKFLKLEFA
jgi:hypothetical protein